MSQITGISSITGLSSWVNQGAEEDVTPDAVNWADVLVTDGVTFSYSQRQISGISSSITIKVQYTPTFSATLYYYVSNTSGDIVSGDGSSGSTPSSYGMSSISNNGTFSVSNNQYVTFGVTVACAEFCAVTVKNQSNGDAIIDTFNAYQAGEC